MKLVDSIKLGILTLVTVAAALQSDVFAQGTGAGRLTGTWDTVVTIRNCATGNQITQFQSVGSFNQGGTFSGITAGSAPAARSSERGVWQHIKANSYRFRFKAYLFNPAGVAIAYQVVTHNLELDRDALTWTSQGISEVFQMDGTPLSTGCSTASATVMSLD